VVALIRRELEALKSQPAGAPACPMGTDARYGRCDSCGEPVNALDSAWRFAGTHWEHRCEGVHPQAGHPGTAARQDDPVTVASLKAERLERIATAVLAVLSQRETSSVDEDVEQAIYEAKALIAAIDKDPTDA